jgi:cyanophycinase-like exopeptidase
LIVGNTTINEGLGLVNAMIEPQVISDARFGRMFALAYQNPTFLAIGLPDNAALQFDGAAVTVLGANSVVTLDLSAATLAEGENGGFIWANGLLDTFANGEIVSFASVGE